MAHNKSSMTLPTLLDKRWMRRVGIVGALLNGLDLIFMPFAVFYGEFRQAAKDNRQITANIMRLKLGKSKK